jgi:type VI secretion system secreted protein VgrG
VPELFRLTQRRNNRIYQQKSIPDIIDALLGEWGIEKVWKIERSKYPKLEYKVQYAESDYSFLSRLIEEAGIAYTYPEDQGGTLTFGDALHTGAMRAGGNIRYVDRPSQASEQEYVTAVRFSREVRPGKYAIRDYEFRNPDFALFGYSEGKHGIEHFHFDQAAFLVESGKGGGTPVADDRGVARHDAKYGTELAERSLYGERVGIKAVAFEANTFDLAPGSVFSMAAHPHPELSTSRKLLVLESTFEGTAEGEWTLLGEAVLTEEPYRPPRLTRKPIVHGLQCATVVGPKGQEIHTDEFGRVRVQLPWDREGSNDEKSSCWMRVNQGWGGMGYGMIMLPRVGQEVLVGFLGGNPDAPIVVGRVTNAINPPPYSLPANKTVSSWRTQSTPATGGYNEIRLEDRAHEEHFYVQAERDFERLVKRDQTARVGRDARADIAHDERHTVGNDHALDVGRDRTESVGRDASRRVGRTDRTVVEGERSVDVGGDCIERTGANHHVSVAKDEHVRIGGSERRTIGADGHFAIRGARHDDVGADLDVRVGGAQRSTVGGDLSFQVGGDLHARATGTHGLEAEAIHVRAGTRLVLEAGARLTLRGPGGFIDFYDGGIDIVGTLVRINSGGDAADGTGVHVAAAGPADEAAPRTPAR